MSISAQAVDGLINRLLQQNSKPSAGFKQSTANPAQTAAKHDQVSISSTAQQHNGAAQDAALSSQSQQQAPTQAHNGPGERALESHLLNLYKSNDSFASQ